MWSRIGSAFGYKLVPVSNKMLSPFPLMPRFAFSMPLSPQRALIPFSSSLVSHRSFCMPFSPYPFRMMQEIKYKSIKVPLKTRVSTAYEQKRFLSIPVSPPVIPVPPVTPSVFPIAITPLKEIEIRLARVQRSINYALQSYHFIGRPYEEKILSVAHRTFQETFKKVLESLNSHVQRVEEILLANQHNPSNSLLAKQLKEEWDACEKESITVKNQLQARARTLLPPLPDSQNKHLQGLFEEIIASFQSSLKLNAADLQVAVKERLLEPALDKLEKICYSKTSAPTCFISYSWSNAVYVKQVHRIACDLRRAGIQVKLDIWDNDTGSIQVFIGLIEKTDAVIVMGTPDLLEKWRNYESGGKSRHKAGEAYTDNVVAQELDEVFRRLRLRSVDDHGIINVLISGDQATSFPGRLSGLPSDGTDFRDRTRYIDALFNLLAKLSPKNFQEVKESKESHRAALERVKAEVLEKYCRIENWSYDNLLAAYQKNLNVYSKTQSTLDAEILGELAKGGRHLSLADAKIIKGFQLSSRNIYLLLSAALFFLYYVINKMEVQELSSLNEIEKNLDNLEKQIKDKISDEKIFEPLSTLMEYNSDRGSSNEISGKDIEDYENDRIQFGGYLDEINKLKNELDKIIVIFTESASKKYSLNNRIHEIQEFSKIAFHINEGIKLTKWGVREKDIQKHIKAKENLVLAKTEIEKSEKFKSYKYKKAHIEISANIALITCRIADKLDNYEEKYEMFNEALKIYNEIDLLKKDLDNDLVMTLPNARIFVNKIILRRKIYGECSNKDKLEIKKLYKSYRDNIDVVNQYSLILSNDGEHDSAIRAMKKILKKYPYNPALRGNLAYIFLKSKKLNEAYMEIQLALEYMPESYEFIFTRGMIYFFQEKYELSKNDFEKLLKNDLLDGKDEAIIVRHKLGEVYLNLNNYDEALNNFENVSTLLSSYKHNIICMDEHIYNKSDFIREFRESIRILWEKYNNDVVIKKLNFSLFKNRIEALMRGIREDMSVENVVISKTDFFTTPPSISGSEAHSEMKVPDNGTILSSVIELESHPNPQPKP